ncbi:MAG: pyridoxal phosphate-dependent aminotransferase [Hyphomicrobiales bacterium]|nr:pyridoxal phosphate-dependent aminotransferase [Hyphomicrobiales bacterium]
MLKLASNLARLGDENAFTVLARAAELAAQGRDIINLGIGQPDFQTPPHIVEAAAKALRDGHHGYTPAVGIPALREAVAADIQRRLGVDVHPDRIVVVPGGKVTMFFAILMFAEEGAEIVFPDPGFPIYQSMIEYSPAKAVPLPIREENGFGFSADDVLERITPRTSLIVLNSPANPTGGVTPAHEIERLVEGLRDWPDVAILSDEIYGQMTYDGLAHQSLLAFEELRERLILLDGWSKTYAMTGWRMGYGVWPEAAVDHMRRLAVNCHSCVNAATQYAGIAALEGPQDCVREMVAAFDERRAFVAERLNAVDGLRCAVPKGAFYAFPNITGTGWNERDLATQLLEQAGIATIAGTDFGAEGAGFIRLSCANSLDNIACAIDRIEAFLAEAAPVAGGEAARQTA